MRTDRFADIDLRTLPADPSPADMWQDRAACFGHRPRCLPLSEEEAGPALTYADRAASGGVSGVGAQNGERYGVWVG